MDWVYALNEMKKNRGLTTDDVVERSGMPKGTLNKIFSGQTRSPQLDTIAKLVHCMGYTLDDLEDMDKPSIAQPPHYADLPPYYRSVINDACASLYETYVELQRQELEERYNEEQRNNVLPFRLSDQPASAGHGFDLGPENFHNIYVQKGCLPHNASFGVPVAGNSMEPKYHDGDILVVDGQPVDEGEIGVFTLNGDGYVKKLKCGKLISLNPDYEPIELHEYDQFKHNGRVIGVLDPECIVER